MRKRLFFDIEVSPNLGFFWSPGHKISLGYENIIKERAVICISYKFEGKKIHSLTWDKGCDRKMLAEFIKVADEADELIGHNSDKFDLTWIRTRCLYHRIPMFPNYTSIDTLKASRSKFRFNSNRLDYIGKFLGVGKKIHTGFDLWKDIVLKNCKKSMSRMVRYCEGDVRLLERVFKLMNPYLPIRTNYAVLNGCDRKDVRCPECGSEKVHINKYRVSAHGYKSVQYRCNNCGKSHARKKYDW